MSVTFRPAVEGGRQLFPCTCEGEDLDCSGCRVMLNVHNAGAAELLRYVGIEPDPYLTGWILARELVERCTTALRGLRPEPAIPAAALSSRASIAERPAGYCRDRCAGLLDVALAAGNAWVAWA